MATLTAAEPASVLCDALAGIVRTCVELPLEADDPRVFCFVSEAADLARLDPGAPRSSPYGCGVGLSRDAARAAAVGEIVEGYAASVYAPGQVVHAAFDELDEPAVPPEAFALFSERQHARFRAHSGSGRPPYAPFTRRTRTGWVHGWNLAARRAVLVPAPFVYLPYRYGPGEPYIADALSTGTACAPTPEEAALKALCEVVERDAISIVWHHALARPRIAQRAGDPLGRLVADRFACRGARYLLLDATLDVPIPTVIAVFLDERGGAAVGAATRPRPFDAACKALLEAAQCRVAWKRDLVRGAGRTYAPDFHDVADFADHGRLYTRREMRGPLELLWSAEREVSLSDLPSAAAGDAARDLACCVERVGRVGLEPIALDLTSDDVREAGLHVVRVVVPGMEALHARHSAPFRGGARMREVPYRLGLSPRPAEEDELNPFPHPFP